RFLSDRLLRQPASNVRLIAGDAACILHHLVADRSVAAYHIYFTDPWWKTRHHRRRLLTAQLAHTLARTLIDGGPVYFASDVELVDTLAREVLLGSGFFA